MASSLARNSVANGIAGFATTLGGVLSTIIIARILGVEGTGVVAFAVWIVTFSLLAADLGVPGTLTRYVSSTAATGDPKTPAGVVASLYLPFAVSNAVVAAAFFGYAVWLWYAHGAPAVHIDADNYRSAPLFWALIGGATLAQAFANFTNASLRGFGQFRKLSIIAIVSAVLQVATALIGASVFGIAGALTGAILGYIVPAAMARGMIDSSATIDPELKRRIQSYAVEAWFGFIVTAFAWSRMEVFFLERSLGSEAVGLFTAALTLSNIATQGPMLLTGALLPFLARQTALEDREKLRRTYATVMRLFTLAIAPACLGLAAISGQLVPLIFGNDFAPAAPAAIVLLIASAITVSASISTIYLLALEKTRIVLLFASIGAVLVVAAGFLVIPHFGPVGAAASRGAIQFIVVAASVLYAARYLDAPAPLAELARILLSATIMGIAAYAAAQSIGGAPGVIAAIVTGVLVYALMLKTTGALTASDAAELTSSTEMLPKPMAQWATRALRAIAPAA